MVGPLPGRAQIADMHTWIALLRGINVGGANRLPMAGLRDRLSELGFEDVETYIASGNVVFGASGDPADADHAETLADRIAATIETHHGFRPRVIVLSAAEFRNAMEANPYPEGEPEPKTLHLYFLAEQPADLDPAALDGMTSPTERWELGDHVLYLHAPDGIGRSKLAARVESLLGVPATARNWRTVTRVWEMVAARKPGG